MSNPPSPTNSNNFSGAQEPEPFVYRHSYTLNEIPSQIFYLKDQQSRFNAAEYNRVRREIHDYEQQETPALQATLMQAPHRKSNSCCHHQCCTGTQQNCETAVDAARKSPIPSFHTNQKGVRVY
jgi:uncharacterized protein YdcH (DUF465 family)